ncbi:MAG: hypothetical protein ACYC5Y_04975 [Symbiobacteriia bacterium]
MTQAVVAAPAEIQAEASKLVDAICNQVDDEYLRGHLDFETLTCERLAAYMVSDGESLEDLLAARNDNALEQAVYRDLDQLLQEYRQRARDDAQEHYLMTHFPYRYSGY